MKIPMLFKIEIGTESFSTIRKTINKIRAARKARNDFVKNEILNPDSAKYRIVWTTGQSWGVIPVSIDLPHYWRPIRSNMAVYMPSTKFKHSRNLRAEMLSDKYTIPDRYDGFIKPLNIMSKFKHSIDFDLEEINTKCYVVMVTRHIDTPDSIKVPNDFVRISDIEYEKIAEKRKKDFPQFLSLNKIYQE